ncbi:MAG: PIG-L family deacetylase [Chloroflexi bacterium]|nr:PIG-L family deacetylase [Chloroflexota bacterium]
MRPLTRPDPDAPCILGIFAHPDDESFMVGGTLAHYASQGVYTAILCATKGEAGEIADPSLATRETLGQVRAGELRRAARVLGVRAVRFLGELDGQAATWNVERLRSLMVQAIRQLRPWAVVTFPPGGTTRHPDHMAVSRLATEAFHWAADPSRYPWQLVRGLAPFQARRLFYGHPPSSVGLERVLARLAKLGIPTEKFREDFGGLALPEETDIHVVMDVSATVDVKLRALLCHRTQMPAEGFVRALPPEALPVVLGTEFFQQVWPVPAPGVQLGGLLDGLP